MSDRLREIEERLLANAELTEKALDFMADPEQIEEAKADVALWREAASELRAARARADVAEQERDRYIVAHDGPKGSYALLSAAREALIRCAEIAGEDGKAVEAARSGAMKQPTVEEFAIRAVEQMRQDYVDLADRDAFARDQEGQG